MYSSARGLLFGLEHVRTIAAGTGYGMLGDRAAGILRLRGLGSAMRFWARRGFGLLEELGDLREGFWAFLFRRAGSGWANMILLDVACIGVAGIFFCAAAYLEKRSEADRESWVSVG